MSHPRLTFNKQPTYVSPGLLTNQIKEKKITVAVLGLGYVGLPLATKFARAGFDVIGLDVDTNKIMDLNQGHSYVLDVASAEIDSLVQQKKLKVSSNFSYLRKADAIIICVPTPLRKTKEPDVGFILSAVLSIKKSLRRGQLIVLESTTYPGTTRDLILPQLQTNKFKVGKDFFLAFSPERIDPGNSIFGLENTPKVIGGITKNCVERAQALYETIIQKVILVSSTECAEMVKLLENTFRSVNIGLVNEVALMCAKLNLDVWEVIEAAASKPFGFMPFYPGPGIGGHCIPLDPHYLSWKLRSLNFSSRFIELATTINASMPEYVVERIGELLNKKGKSFRNSKLLMIGVTYKKNVSDTRESPALDVISLLIKKGAAIDYSDPHVPRLSAGAYKGRSRTLSKSYLKVFDCVVIMANHSAFDMDFIVRNSNQIFDTRNATQGIKSRNISKL